MSDASFEVKMIRVDEIKPNPFQPRTSFQKEEIEELAKTIKNIGLLQPISVRKHGNMYQIISGERRWRASQIAGLEKIPAIIKDINDGRLMAELFIENVQRKDLEPIERARGLAEIYRLNGFEPLNVMSKLRMIEGVVTREVKREELTKEEQDIKKIADMVGLSYKHQYRILSQLRLTIDEQDRATELKLGIEQISSISSIENNEDRRKFLEIAPSIERNKISTISKIIRKGKKPIKDAVLNKEIEPEIAEEILEIKNPEIQQHALDIAKKGIYTKEGFKYRILQLTKPRIDLPKDTMGIQIFNKIMWNLKRTIDYDIYTIGYENKSIKQLIELLKVKMIKTVIDVRKNPISQYKPEFSKDNFEAALKKKGIEYEHIPELGVPSDIRRRLEESGDYEGFFQQYDEKILPNIENYVTDFEILGYPIAFLCVEFDPTKCHRHRIALWFEKRGFRSYDL